jgi:hypothetical protein
MRSTLQDIISQLPFLSAKELDKLHQRIKALKTASEPVVKAANGSLNADAVIDTICTVLCSRGINCAKFVIHKQGQTEKIELLLKFIMKAVHNRVEQEALLTIAIDLLWQNMAQQHIPTTGNTLLRNVHLIPAIMNQHFPGYARAGHLKVIIGRHKNGGS